MNILSAWRESLRMFTPSNMRLIGLATLAAMRRVLQSFARMWWQWLAVIFLQLFAVLFLLLLTYGALFSSIRTNQTILLTLKSLWPLITSNILQVFIALYIVLAARSSVENKSTDYFVDSLKTHWRLIIAALFFPPIGIVGILWSLFVFDFPASWRAIFSAFWQSLRMTFYNLPVLVVMGFIVGIMKSIFMGIMTALYIALKSSLKLRIPDLGDLALIREITATSPLFLFLIAVIIFVITTTFIYQLFLASLLSVIYTREKHQHPQRYLNFKQE